MGQSLPIGLPKRDDPRSDQPELTSDFAQHQPAMATNHLRLTWHLYHHVLYGDVLKWKYPIAGWLTENPLMKWNGLGYPHFRKPPSPFSMVVYLMVPGWPPDKKTPNSALPESPSPIDCPSRRRPADTSPRPSFSWDYMNKTWGSMQFFLVRMRTHALTCFKYLQIYYGLRNCDTYNISTSYWTI